MRRDHLLALSSVVCSLSGLMLLGVHSYQDVIGGTLLAAGVLINEAVR